MPPTKFWAEMSWRDFAAADMSKVVAVLPVAAIEQHGPHLPVGVDMFINEGYFATAIKRIPDDMPVLILPIAGGRQVQRAHRISRHADVFARDGRSRLDRDRRQRRAHRMPQAHFHEFARRQCSGHRRRGEGVAGPPPHARGPRRLAPAGLSGGAVFRAGARPRHPRRRSGDFADARLPAEDRAHGECAKFRQFCDRNRAGVSPASCHPADRLRLDGERSSSARHGGRRFQGERPKKAKLAPTTRRRRLSICCATCWLSIWSA